MLTCHAAWMHGLIYLLALVFGVIAIAVYAYAKLPVLRSLGLTVSRWSPVEIVIGLAISGFAITLTMFAELGLGAIRLEPGSLTGADFGSLIASLSLSAAFEELVFRVLLLSGLAVVLSPVPGGRWIAVVLAATMFGAVHLDNPGATWVAALGTGLGGVMYGIAFLGTRAVWLPFGLHLGWNLSQGLLGFPISGYLVPGFFRAVPTDDTLLIYDGGAYGPEAGIPGMLARFVVIGLVLLYLHRRWPNGWLAALTYASDPVR